MLFTILTMIILFCSCYMAGKLSALLDVNRVERKPFDWKIAVMALVNALLGIYSIIALYGQGIQRGLS